MDIRSIIKRAECLIMGDSMEVRFPIAMQWRILAALLPISQARVWATQRSSSRP